MHSTFVIITLITLFKVGKSEAKNYFYENIPVNEGFTNYGGTHSFQVFNNSSPKKPLAKYTEADYRLPDTVIPYFYDISIFFKKDYTFRGIIKINVMIKSKTNEIVLHHRNIDIDGIKIIFLENNEVHNVTNTSYDKITEKLTIKLEEIFEEDIKVLIVMDYNAVVKDNLIGFYKSSYFDENNELKYLAATQFQAVHARQAFPCFDEPSFKAKFRLRIRVPKEYKCLSNMPILRTTSKSDVIDVTFNESVRMSTYLVAFVISDLESKSSGNFSVWSRKVLIDQGDYALKIGKESLNLFENTFKQKYQINKMDMVAVPDFAAGAMENWGLITYREALMLYHKDESSDAAQQNVATTIVHECSHMWFGNLVTPNWWGVLWLSEGFARYYEYMATDKLEPTWNMDQQFLVAQHQVALSVDGLNFSAPLTRNVISQSEIGQSGDTITYNKGASVLRMVEKSFGSQIFNDALTNYLESRKYENATPEDLWTKIQKEIDLQKVKLEASIETIMNSWTKQPGFPVVSVFIKEGKAILSQKRFLLRNLDSVTTNSTWWIPVTWTAKSNADFTKTVTQQWIFGNETIDIQIKKGDWIIFNVQSAGFYRINYDKETWYRIIDTLNNKNTLGQIHELNRAAILDDLLNLARAEYLDYNVALDGLKYLIEETHYVPYKASLNALQYLTKRFSGQKEYDLYKEFILTLINKTYRKLSYDDKEGDNRLSILLRRELNDLACRFNHGKCIEKSFEYFEKWKSGTLKTIPKNRKFTVYSTAMKNATETDWDALWNRYVESNVPSEQIEILKALGCSQNATILEKYLLWAVSSYKEHRIRKQDSNALFNSVSSCSLYGAEYIIDFIDQHYQKVIHYNGDSVDSISTILSTASQYFSTQELIDKFEELINTHKKEFESIIPSLESQLKLAQYELEWYKKHVKTIVDWINKFKKKEDTSATTDYLLPGDIRPTKYNIHVIPYIKEGNFTFDGTVEIETTVTDITDKIVLHAFEIKHKTIEIFANGTKAEVEAVKYSDDSYHSYNFLTISLADDLLEGTQVKININYTGSLNDKMRGFYRSSYTEDGEIRWLAATHMEPVGARRMFPCFDEPAMKAIFVISVTRPKSYQAISNMPVVSTKDVADGLQKDTFQPTPPMSTYLVALVVSQFSNNGEDYKVWTRRKVITQAKYALSVISPFIKFYENKLNHMYQLPKLDMVALPNFTSGAMENWGLITYKEKRMLYDSKEYSLFDKQDVSNVIAHEIAHQWFGNLVSPLWWKYLWLNEGFARYFQNIASDSVEESWKLPSQFVVDHLQTSFDIDGVTSSHAITHDVYSPTEISGRFNKISYAKAASILRMTEKILGSKIFYQSLHEYLKERQYSVATPEDLYKAFQDQVDNTEFKLDVKTFLDSWTLKPGFPVVSVTVEGEKVTFAQERFLLRNDENYAINQTWWIPITWTTQSENDFNNTVPKYWFKDTTKQILIKKEANDWIIFNIQEAGYYRVNYDSKNWLRIITALKGSKFDMIHEINRASLMDDLFNLGRTGYVTYDIVLSATQYLEQETNYLAWKAAFNGFKYLNKRFTGQDIYDLYRTHIFTITRPIFKKLGMTDIENEGHYDKLLRILIFKNACEFKLPECVSLSKTIFAEWKGNSSVKVPVNHRQAIYCTAIRHGSEDDWEFLLQQYLTLDFSTEKISILEALGCSENPKLLNKLLTKAITEGSEIKFQESLKVFTYIYKASLKGVETVLEFVMNNYDGMQKYYVGEKSIKTILKSISKRLSTKELLLKFQAFIIAKKHSSKMKISLTSYLSRAKDELIWYNKFTPKIWEWLEKTYPSTDYRLPAIIKPFSYNIHLKPYFEEKNFTFEGDVRISMQTIRNTSRIVLQANQLKIEEIRVFDQLGKEFNVSSYVNDTNTHKLSIYLTTTIAAGIKLEASIKYSGVLNDEMQGFYRSSYTDENKQTRWIATTQFQPTHARKAFPCFDEPSFKAKFTVRIERPDDYHTLSNMPIKSSQEIKGVNRTLDVFEESRFMSTYLVAFVVSDFKSLTTADRNFSIWSRSNTIENAQYSLTAATKLLKLLESFTGIKYAFPKMDLVAIPDFKAGAMENWGLVTFREYGLLYRDDVTTANYKKYINTTIAHEFAHMWFGDLVTCDWWDYTWLNEGFAQYFQAVITNSMEPSWKLLEQFVVYEMHTAMAADASEKTHPMNNNVSSPTEISNGFDTIAYKKGASVIRMMHHSFGPQVLKKSIQDYLTKYQYKTAKPEYLWASIQAQVDEANFLGDMNVTIQALMDSWTSQPGHPVVNVTLNNTKMVLTQEQFFLSKVNSSSSNRTYWIPITFTKQSKPNFEVTSPSLWFGNRSIVVDVDFKDEWYILNVQQVGYYRVNYDIESWYRLINLLNSVKFKNIHVVNRAQIIEDALNLARVGYVNYTLALDATDYIINEDNHLPWRALFNGFSYLSKRFQGQKIDDLFAKHIQTIVQKIYKKLGFYDVKGETQLNELNRGLILSWACTYQYADCVKKSKDLFLQWRKNPLKPISPNARPAVYCTALKHGTYEDWQFLWNEYLNTNFPSEKVIILQNLGCSKNVTTLTAYLQVAISSNEIRRQDTATVFSSVYTAGKIGLDACFQFLIKNYKAMYSFFRGWDEVSSIFASVAASMSTSEQIKELETFIKNNSSELIEILPALQSAVTAAKRNQQWFDLHSPEIYAWLKSYYEGKTTIEPTTSSSTPTPTATPTPTLTPTPISTPTSTSTPKPTPTPTAEPGPTVTPKSTTPDPTPTKDPETTSTETNPEVSSTLPPSPGGGPNDGGWSIHWIIALIFLLLICLCVLYKLFS